MQLRTYACSVLNVLKTSHFALRIILKFTATCIVRLKNELSHRHYATLQYIMPAMSQLLFYLPVSPTCFWLVGWLIKLEIIGWQLIRAIAVSAIVGLELFFPLFWDLSTNLRCYWNNFALWYLSTLSLILQKTRQFVLFAVMMCNALFVWMCVCAWVLILKRCTPLSILWS